MAIVTLRPGQRCLRPTTSFSSLSSAASSAAGNLHSVSCQVKVGVVLRTDLVALGDSGERKDDIGVPVEVQVLRFESIAWSAGTPASVVSKLTLQIGTAGLRRGFTTVGDTGIAVLSSKARYQQTCGIEVLIHSRGRACRNHRSTRRIQTHCSMRSRGRTCYRGSRGRTGAWG